MDHTALARMGRTARIRTPSARIRGRLATITTSVGLILGTHTSTHDSARLLAQGDLDMFMGLDLDSAVVEEALEVYVECTLYRWSLLHFSLRDNSTFEGTS